MECHPICELFPPMSGDEFSELTEDIAKHGQRETIKTYQGQIIDGRHRWNACTVLGLAPRFEEWDGRGSMVAYVVSLNLRRRHLTTSQRGMVGAKLLPHLEQEAQERQRQAGRTSGRGRPKKVRADLPEANQGPIAEPADPPLGEHRARDDAAAIVNVSPRTIADAAEILETAPDLAGEVETGAATIHAAKQEARRRTGRTPRPRIRDEDAANPINVKLSPDPVKAAAMLVRYFTPNERLIPLIDALSKHVIPETATA